MECPKCRFQNPDEMKFCGECGTKLEKSCPECGFENPDGFSFCGKCGNIIKANSEPQPIIQSIGKKFEDIQNRITNKFQKNFLAQNKRIEGEYKQVTILFCDLKNFTPLVEELGSEDAYNIMNQVYEVLIHNVHYYDGIVNEMTGDGILAIFGAPIAIEDSPQRAIRSSIKIHKEIAKLSEKLKTENKDIPILKMRAGINSGSVVVGSLGNDLKMEFKVVGNTVNLASRLEGLAEPGTTNVSEETFKLTEGLFRFESLGEMNIKGKKNPEKVYRLISSSNKRTRFDVSAEQGLTPLVGRERELELLVDGFERIRSNNGQIITVVSEAGIGKSRLLYEFRKTISNEDVFFLEGRCLSYSKGISYHLIIDILKFNFDIQDDDQKIREKIVKGLNDLGIDEKEIVPYFLEILSVKDSGINTLIMSPDAIKDKLAESLKLIIQKLSEVKPLIMIVEDLHWTDQSSIEIINLLFEVVPGARVFVIFTYRPEFSPNWGNWSYHSQITLYKLTTKQIATMVSHILGPSYLLGEFIDFVVDRTEGTPFFIEEFIKYLKGHGLIDKKEKSYVLTENIKEIKVPATIQDVVMARIDKVPEKAKKILKIGSVVEREFSYELIGNLVDYPESILLSILSTLKDSALIFERGIFPKSVYVFKHALIREIIYESILSDKKKKYHEQIGFAIEQLSKNTLPEHYEILARHFILGTNYNKGAEYSRYSCRKMLKTASYDNAINHIIKRIECLEKLQRDAEVEKQIIGARILLGLLYIQKNYHVPAMETIQPIIKIAEKKADKRRLSQLYTILGAYQDMVAEDFPGAIKSFKKALKLSEEAKDISSNLQAKYWLGLGQAFHCNFLEAERNLCAVLEANKTFNPSGVSMSKSILSYFIYYYKGNIEKGYCTSLDAIKIAEENQDIYSKSLAYVAYGVLCYCKGFLDKAIEYLKRGVELCERNGFFTWNGMAQICLGDIQYEVGNYEISVDHFNKGTSCAKKCKVGPSWYNIGLIGAIRAKTATEDCNINLEQLTKYVNEIKYTSLEGIKFRFLSEIFFNMGEEYFEKATDLIQRAIQADKKNGMKFSLGKDYYIYAKHLKNFGNATVTEAYYQKAKEIFQRCKADNWVKTIEKELELI